MRESEQMVMDPEGLYDPPLSWSKKERRILKALESQIDTKPQLLDKAKAGDAAAIKALKEDFRMTTYIHKGVRII